MFVLLRRFGGGIFGLTGLLLFSGLFTAFTLFRLRLRLWLRLWLRLLHDAPRVPFEPNVFVFLLFLCT